MLTQEDRQGRGSLFTRHISIKQKPHQHGSLNGESSTTFPCHTYNHLTNKDQGVHPLPKNEEKIEIVEQKKEEEECIPVTNHSPRK